MRIENIYPNVSTTSQSVKFGSAYINMLTLHNYGTTNKKSIIKALKEKNTPLREFMSEVLNTKQFENDMGDCFITFHQIKDSFHLSDIIDFSFPKKHQQAVKHTHNIFESEEYQTIKSFKEEMANHIAEQTSFKARFYSFHINKKQGAEKLAEYITGNKIVEDLKRHIDEFRHKYIV